MIDKKLTLKQQTFAEHYIETGNATESAVKAGYSKKYANTNASKLLQNTTVKSYIEEKLSEMSSERIASATEVMEYLTKVMRREHKEYVPVTIMKENSKWMNGKKQTSKIEEVKIVEIPAKLSDANKAAELLGKRYKLFTDKLEASTSTQVVIVDDI